MKALTLTQPWASLVALQEKKIETRSWYTGYRGELIIHAAKGFPSDCKELCGDEPFRTALRGQTWNQLPLSRGLCVVRLLGCIRTTDMYKAAIIQGRNLSLQELDFGNFEQGRFAWLLEYVRPLNQTQPVRGSLGLWEYPSGLVRL